MKKFAFALALVASVAVSAPVALADHNIYNDDNTKVVSVISDEAWNKAQAEAYARQNPSTALVVAAGVTVTNGTLSDTCPIWFFKFQCVAPAGWHLAQ